MKVYVSKAEYNQFIKYQANLAEYYKKNTGTPLTLELWADEEDLRDCCNGQHIKELLIQKQK